MDNQNNQEMDNQEFEQLEQNEDSEKVGELKMLMVSFSRGKLTALLRSIGSEQPKRAYVKGASAPPCTHYTSVTRHYTCLTCGNTFSATHQFSKGEKVTTVSPDGSTQTTTITDKMQNLDIQTTTSRCHRCRENIRAWDRDKLEEAFIKLLHASTIKEVQILNTIQETREIKL